MNKIRVTKWNAAAKIIAQTEVDTLEAARAFLDGLNDDGTPKAKPQPKQPTPCQQQQCKAVSKLPPVAYIQSEYNQAGAPVIAVKRGESGFYPIFTARTADELNAAANVTKAQAAAMHVGSMFGWHVPAADPDRYDADGKLMKRQPTPSQQQQGKAPTPAPYIIRRQGQSHYVVATRDGLSAYETTRLELARRECRELNKAARGIKTARAALAAAKGQA